MAIEMEIIAALWAHVTWKRASLSLRERTFAVSLYID